MLVFTRLTRQRFFINDNIAVQIVNVGGGRVRVGVEAPEYVTVAREELLSAQRAAALLRSARGEPWVVRTGVPPDFHATVADAVRRINAAMDAVLAPLDPVVRNGVVAAIYTQVRTALGDGPAAVARGIDALTDAAVTVAPGVRS